MVSRFRNGRPTSTNEPAAQSPRRRSACASGRCRRSPPVDRDCRLAREASAGHDVIVALDALAWDELRRSRLGRSGSTARLPQIVRTGSEVGVEEDGCSPPRAGAGALAGCRGPGRQQAHRRLPQSRQGRAGAVADHDAGPSRAWRCARLATSATLANDGVKTRIHSRRVCADPSEARLPGPTRRPRSSRISVNAPPAWPGMGGPH
jgi:hypothetical protein